MTDESFANHVSQTALSGARE